MVRNTAHRDHDAHQREQVAEDRPDTRRHQLVQRVHVVGDARHEAADRRAVVVGDRQALEVAEQRHAQVHHHRLAHALHDLVLDVVEAEAHRQDAQVEGRDLAEMDEIVVADPVVDRLLGEPRAGEAHQGFGHDDDPREQHLPAVGAEEPHQAAHEPVVVAAAEDFLFVNHEASISSSSCCSRHSAA